MCPHPRILFQQFKILDSNGERPVEINGNLKILTQESYFDMLSLFGESHWLLEEI
jgi:hypothetical protein